MGRMGAWVRSWWPLCWRSTCAGLLAEVEALRPRAEAWDGLVNAYTDSNVSKVRSEAPGNLLPFRSKKKKRKPAGDRS